MLIDSFLHKKNPYERLNAAINITFCKNDFVVVANKNSPKDECSLAGRNWKPIGSDFYNYSIEIVIIWKKIGV